MPSNKGCLDVGVLLGADGQKAATHGSVCSIIIWSSANLTRRHARRGPKKHGAHLEQEHSFLHSLPLCLLSTGAGWGGLGSCFRT